MGRLERGRGEKKKKTEQVSQIKQNFVNQAKELRLYSKSSRDPLISEYHMIRFCILEREFLSQQSYRGEKMGGQEIGERV